MAENTAFRNNALPYPIYGAPWVEVVPILDADGDPVTSASGLDSEISLNGDTMADAGTESEIGNGLYAIAFTSANMTADVIPGVLKTSTSGAKNTPFRIYPRKLVTVRSGTSASGGVSTSTIVLDSGASAEDDFYNGMVCIATIDGNVEVRVISDYVGSTKTATVVPDWNVAPDNDDTFVIKLPDGWQVHQSNQTMLGGSSQSTTDLKDFVDTGYDPSSHKVQNVLLTDTVTTYTGNTPQTGDSYAVVSHATHGNAALNTDLDSLLTRLTSARAGYLDNLNIGGNVASSTEVSAIQNNTRVVRVVPAVIERPDSGNQTYRIEVLLYDAVGNMEAPDSAPTIALVDQGGTDLSSRLDSTTMSLVSTGRYRAVYTATDTDDLEQLVWAFSIVEGGNTRIYGNTTLIVDTTAVDFTSADRTKLSTVETAISSASHGNAALKTLLDALTVLAQDIPTNSELSTALINAFTTALTEGYRSTGSTGSIRDILYEILALMINMSISSTTMTTKKLDKSTTAKSYTLNSSTAPTSVEELS